MARSALHTECASSSESSPSRPSFSSHQHQSPQASEPFSHGKLNRKPRKRGARTQSKASKEADLEGGPVPLQPSTSPSSSRVSDECSNAERPAIPQPEASASATEDLPSQNSMARESFTSHSLYAFLTWYRVQIIEFYVQQKPYIDAFIARVLDWRCRAQLSIQRAWPPLRHASVIIGGIAVGLALSWLNCAIQGAKSLVRMGSAAFFVVICCSALNLGILGGFFKLFICLVLSAAAAFFFGYIYALVILGIFCGFILWLYGSFWLTGGVLLLGGILFTVEQPRVALSIGVLYSMYSARSVGGWLGLFVCLNLSFVLSNLMVYLLHPNDTGTSAKGTTGTNQGHTNQSKKNRTRRGEQAGASDDAKHSTDSCQGGPEIAKNARINEGEGSAVDKEVERLLSCKDHYEVLDLSRFAEVDPTTLKRDYRKKAMLVHPDKNLGNTVAEEAFKRLQNAYEVLLDPSKKQGYDDELKREEVLLALKRFQQEVCRNGRAGTSDNWCTHTEDELDEDSATRRIVCKKCNNTHRWICTDKNKLHARWCQECQDHHQAKDGDGWVEQVGHTFFFGMFQKVDMPRAYACADSKIYEVTEWVQCQGMKCVANTHKPSFHVSTAGIFKTQSRGSRANRAFFADAFPFAHMNENMTEEDFMKWLENAMASGMFNEMNEAPDPADPKSGARAKPSKKKRKGKNKW